MRIDDGVNNYRFTEVDIDWALQTDERSRARSEMRAILVKLSKLVDHVTAPPVDETRLTEATALLERCCPLTPPGSELRILTRAFVFGAEAHCSDPLCDFDDCGTPAQPAQAWHVRGATVELRPAQPAASAPECRYGESFCGDTSCPTHGIEQPAAPDLSLPNSTDGNVWAYQFCERNPAVDEATMRLWFIGAVNAGLKAGRAEPTAPEPSAAIPECTMRHRPAACLGSYESNTAWGYSCNECCGHGNEDGCCFPLSEIPARYLALVRRLMQLEDDGYPACAPEPSAEFSRGYKEGSDATAHELLSGRERDNRLADAVVEATDHLNWHTRMMSAETQLAAVRERDKQVIRLLEEFLAESRTGEDEHVDAALALLTAPSPGAGEKT